MKIEIINAKVKINILAIITGEDLIRIPYTNQRKTPIVNKVNIPKDISLVDFVFQVLITCGKKAIVVNIAAPNPIIVI